LLYVIFYASVLIENRQNWSFKWTSL